MKLDRSLFFAAIILVAVALPSLLQARTWTEAATGRSLEGDYVESDGTNVIIKRASGGTFKIPIERLSEADKTFIKAQSATPAGSSEEGASAGAPLAKLTPPASAKGAPVTGEGDDRNSKIDITNNGDKAITGFVVDMLYLKADGSVGKSVPHTHSGKGFGKGKTHTHDVNSFFMKDDTASVDGLISELTFEDESTWPAAPAEPPAQNGDDPVAAAVIGILGEGDRAEPAVVCHNHGSKDIKSVSYRIEYLDAKGEVLDTTSYGYAGGDDPILPSGKSIVITGGDGPPEGAVDAKASVSRLTFADESNWEPAK